MGFELFDAEGWVNGLYGAARFELDQPRGAVALARKLLGDDAVREAWHDGLVDEAALLYEWGRPRIYVRKRITPARRNFAVAHEIAEWALDCEGYREDDRELFANAIAAGIVAPREAFLPLFRDYGFDLATLAAQFNAPEGLIALRVGETTETAVALVTGAKVRRRDPHNQLPSDRELASLVRQALDPWYPLHFDRLADAPGSVAVRSVFDR